MIVSTEIASCEESKKREAANEASCALALRRGRPHGHDHATEAEAAAKPAADAHAAANAAPSPVAEPVAPASAGTVPDSRPALDTEDREKLAEFHIGDA